MEVDDLIKRYPEGVNHPKITLAECSKLENLLKSNMAKVKSRLTKLAPFLIASLLQSEDMIITVAISNIRLCIPHIQEQLQNVVTTEITAIQAHMKKCLEQPGTTLKALLVWRIVIEILGVVLHKNRVVVNTLLIIPEKAFKSTVPIVQKNAFIAWKELIDNFALNSEVISHIKRIKLILQPMVSNKSKVDEVLISRCDTWWHLAVKLQDKLTPEFEKVCIPLLRFVFQVPVASPGRIGSSGNPEGESISCKALQLRGCEILLRVLEQPSLTSPGGLSSPKKMPDISASQLKVPVPHLTIAKHSEFLLELTRKSLVFLNTLQPGSPLSQALIQMLLVRMNALSKEKGKDEVEAVAQFIQFVRTAIKEKLDGLGFKLIDDVTRLLSSKVLTSHCYHQAMNSMEVMNGVPALGFLEMLLSSTVFLKATTPEKFIVVFNRLVNAGVEEADIYLSFTQTVLNHLKELLDNQAKDLGSEGTNTLLSLWTHMANALWRRIQKSQDVNQGDTLEHDFSCLLSALNFPLRVQLTTEKSIQSKELERTWSQLCKAFLRCAALVNNTDANIACEELCSQALSLLDENSLKKASVLRWIAFTSGILLSSIDFQSVNTVPSAAAILQSPERWRKRQQQPLGNLTAFANLQVQPLKSVFVLVTDEAIQTDEADTCFAEFLVNITSLLGHVTLSAMFIHLVTILGPSLLLLFQGTFPPKKQTLHQKKIHRVWETLVNGFLVHYKGPHSQDTFDILRPLLEPTLLHSHKFIQERARNLWLYAFADIYQTIKFPESFKTVLKEVQPALVPGGEISSVDSITSFVQSLEEAPTTPKNSSRRKSLSAELQAAAKSEHFAAPSPKSPAVKIGKHSNKKGKSDQTESKEEVFVKIPPSPKSNKRILTEHQKEVLKEKSHIPALYNDLTSTQDDTQLSQSQDSESPSTTVDVSSKPEEVEMEVDKEKKLEESTASKTSSGRRSLAAASAECKTSAPPCPKSPAVKTGKTSNKKGKSDQSENKEEEPTTPKNSSRRKSLAAELQASAESETFAAPSPKSPAVKTGKTSNKKGKSDQTESKEEVFVEIPPSPKSNKRILTEHQKEVLKEKSHIPALYNDLTSTQDDTQLSQDSQSQSVTVIETSKPEEESMEVEKDNNLECQIVEKPTVQIDDETTVKNAAKEVPVIDITSSGSSTLANSVCGSANTTGISFQFNVSEDTSLVLNDRTPIKSTEYHSDDSQLSGTDSPIILPSGVSSKDVRLPRVVKRDSKLKSASTLLLERCDQGPHKLVDVIDLSDDEDIVPSSQEVSTNDISKTKTSKRQKKKASKNRVKAISSSEDGSENEAQKSNSSNLSTERETLVPKHVINSVAKLVDDGVVPDGKIVASHNKENVVEKVKEKDSVVKSPTKTASKLGKRKAVPVESKSPAKKGRVLNSKMDSSDEESKVDKFNKKEESVLKNVDVVSDPAISSSENLLTEIGAPSDASSPEELGTSNEKLQELQETQTVDSSVEHIPSLLAESATEVMELDKVSEAQERLVSLGPIESLEVPDSFEGDVALKNLNTTDNDAEVEMMDLDHSVNGDVPRNGNQRKTNPVPTNTSIEMKAISETSNGKIDLVDAEETSDQRKGENVTASQDITEFLSEDVVSDTTVSAPKKRKSLSPVRSTTNRTTLIVGPRWQQSPESLKVTTVHKRTSQKDSSSEQERSDLLSIAEVEEPIAKTGLTSNEADIDKENRIDATSMETNDSEAKASLTAPSEFPEKVKHSPIPSGKRRVAIISSSPLSRSHRMIQAAIKNRGSEPHSPSAHDDMLVPSPPVKKPRHHPQSLMASPSSGILKVKTPSSEKSGSPSPNGQKRRVSFADLPVRDDTENTDTNSDVYRCLEMPVPTNEVIAEENSQVDSLCSTLTQKEMEESEDLEICSQSPVYPGLLDCKDSVQIILHQLTSSMWSRGLDKLLRSQSISTVGQLSALTYPKVESLPIPSPKLKTLRSVLAKYHQKLHSRKGFVTGAVEKQSALSDQNDFKDAQEVNSEQHDNAVNEEDNNLPCTQDLLLTQVPSAGLSSNALEDISDEESPLPSLDAALDDRKILDTSMLRQDAGAGDSTLVKSKTGCYVENKTKSNSILLEPSCTAYILSPNKNDKTLSPTVTETSVKGADPSTNLDIPTDITYYRQMSPAKLINIISICSTVLKEMNLKQS